MSYSHAADGRLAPALQAALQRLAKPWYRLKALSIFRDKTSLALTPKLWPRIEEALTRSEWFLLLASPAAASSPWVQQEIAYWLENKSIDTFLIILTDGEVAWDAGTADFDWRTTTALPERLLSRAFGSEPFWADLRPFKTRDELSLKYPDFADEVARIAARPRATEPAALLSEEVRQHRNVRRLVSMTIVTLVALTLFAGGSAYVAVQQRDEALRQRNIALSRLLVFQAARSLDADPDLGLLLSVEASRANDTAEARSGLLGAVGRHPHLEAVLLRHTASVLSAAWSPDGKTLASAGEDSKIILWDATTRQPVGEPLAGHKGPVTGIAFSRDGGRLVTAGQDGTVIVWDARSRRAVGEPIETRRGGVRSVAVDPDGSVLAIGSDDGSVIFWDLSSRRRVGAALQGHSNAAQFVVFAPNGRSLASGGADGSVRVWDVASQKSVGRPLMAHAGGVNSVAFSPDGRTLGLRRRRQHRRSLGHRHTQTNRTPSRGKSGWCEQRGIQCRRPAACMGRR